MAYEIYKIVHIVGIAFLLLGLGAVVFGEPSGAPRSRPAGAARGIGLLLLVVAGMGMLHRGGFGFPGWVFAKIGAWVLLAVLPVLTRRGVIPAKGAWLGAAALAGVAAWLAVSKPF